ncbi:serine hydroxymethyltransferase [SAR202 cluster bacterium AD-804-J14_MRT_500m]|nr:serine hydroxymethyltransferase [SAR202 cluster bacterium AD-804-J14_MRT_500m]
MKSLLEADPQVARAIEMENQRQRSNIVLIASENYASKTVLETQSSVMNNKYAEGYPNKRYYGGCQYVDLVEELARQRAKELFGVEHSNVQPHSGAQANMGAYFSLLDPGDTVMGMRLDQGGHLTHGSPVNFSGKLYNFVGYGVDRDTEIIDFEEVEGLAYEHRPKIIVAGYTAYPRVIDFERFRRIADQIGALLMVDMAHIAGLIAGKAHPSPAPYADVITSTTQKTLRGPRGGLILSTQNLARKVDRGVFPNVQGGPFMHVIAAKAVCFGEALEPGFTDYAHAVVGNAKILASSLANGGLRIVSGGTDNHLLLVDLRPLGVKGDEAEEILGDVSIVVNKNAIPYDPEPPRVTSGLRLGSAAVTSRGFNQEDMRVVGGLIVRALIERSDKRALMRVREEAEALASAFPVPGLDS